MRIGGDALKQFVRRVLSKTLGLQIYRGGDLNLLAFPNTAQTNRRLVYFYDLLTQVEEVDGDIVECGVGRGATLFALSVLSSLFDRERHLYGFDSFQGLPEPSKEDDPDSDVVTGGRFAFGREEVVGALSRSGLPPNFIENRITLVGGYFSESLARYDGAGIALLHLDVDLYQSYRETLEYLYPRVNKGGIITFDEYRDPLWVGATRAIDEFFAGRETITKSPIFSNGMRAGRSSHFAGPSYEGDPDQNARYWENEKAMFYVVKQ